MARIHSVNASARCSDPKAQIGSGCLQAGHGLVGDAHAGLSEREVSLLGIESVWRVNHEQGINAGPGSFAENLTTEGLDLLSLRLGDRLQVGEQALLEVVQIGKPPSDSHTYNYQGVSILPREGVFCRVLRGGPVAAGDNIAVLGGRTMRVACLIDNSVEPRSRYWGEHGLSFLLEVESQRLLLDTGASATILGHNLALRQVSPRDLHAVALSHGHRDHTGGLGLLLQAHPRLPLYAHPAVCEPRYSKRGDETHEIGMPPEIIAQVAQGELHTSRGPQEIVPGVWTTGEIVDRPEPEGRGAGHLVRRDGRMLPDPYIDDLSLVLRTERGLTLLCGCCHAGLLNTLEQVRRNFGAYPRVIAGGTHLVGSDAAGIAHVIARLQEIGVEALYPNHCTGQAAYVALATALGDSVHPCPAGTVLEV